MMKKSVLVFFSGLFLLWQTSLDCAAQTPRFETLAREFEYDRQAPLDVREVGKEKRAGGVAVIDLTYASPKGGRVPAYVVVPAGRGPFAGVLFGHWMMEGSPL